METRADQVKAVVYAVLVHVVCLLLAFSGLFWWQTGKPLRAAGEPIEAVFVDLAALAPAAPPRPAPRPAPPPPPPPQQPEPPTDLQADDTVDQQRIDQQALLQAEEEAREQEERRRRAEQVLLEEQERQRAEEERRREQQQQREREQREQEQREAAERAAAEAAEREAAEAAARAAAQVGQRGEDDSLLARYGAAITEAVHRRWRMPDNSPRVVCTMQIVQVRGGTILSARAIRPCNADEPTRATLERAVLAAEPLPYEGFESVFRREIELTFCHPQDLQECMQ